MTIQPEHITFSRQEQIDIGLDIGDVVMYRSDETVIAMWDRACKANMDTEDNLSAIFQGVGTPFMLRNYVEKRHRLSNLAGALGALVEPILMPEWKKTINWLYGPTLDQE